MKQLHPRAVWLFFFRSAWWLVVAFLIIVTGLSAILLEEEIAPVSISGIIQLGWMILTLILLYLWAKLTYHYYRYEFTDTAFKKEHGVIWKKYVSIPYDRVQNVDIYRGVIARLLGLSDLQIQTAGGITAGSYGAFSEGRLPGLTKEEADRLREELIQRVQQAKSQGL